MISFKHRYVSIFIIALVLVAIFALNVLAVEDFNAVEKAIDSQKVENTKAPNLFLNFVKLIFILALIVAAAWSIIRLFGKKASSRLQGTWIHVVDEVMLGQNRGIVLCEAGEKVYAIGVTDHNISVLFEVDNPKMLEEISQGNITLVHNENKWPWDNWKEVVAGIFKPRKSVSSPDNFHALIEQQARRLEELSYRGAQNTEADSRRSDDNV